MKVGANEQRTVSCRCRMPRELYIRSYGPTTGDRIVLGDTSLVIEIERDLIAHGDELTFGIGKVSLLTPIFLHITSSMFS